MKEQREKMNIGEIQRVCLRTIGKIVEIAEKIDATYFLMYGTLLGCIRHHGFIPWDDDVDIAMPRKDYDRFCAYFNEHAEELYPYKLCNRETVENYPYYISKLSDERYTTEIRSLTYHSGIWVDLYPFDGIGNDEDKEFWLCNWKRCQLYQKGAMLASMDKGKFVGRNWLTKCLNRLIYPYCRRKGTEYFLKKLERYNSIFSWEESKYVGDPMWDPPLFIERKDVERQNLIYKEFEGMLVLVPKEYDKILRMIYGEYMKLPPVEDRIGHHFFVAYKK